MNRFLDNNWTPNPFPNDKFQTLPNCKIEFADSNFECIENTVWKRRTSLLKATSPFPAVFSKDLYWKQELVWERVNHTIPRSNNPGTENFNSFNKQKIFKPVKIESFCRRQNEYDVKTEICCWKERKHFGKGRKCWLPAFSPFPWMFKSLLP